MTTTEIPKLSDDSMDVVAARVREDTKWGNRFPVNAKWIAERYGIEVIIEPLPSAYCSTIIRSQDGSVCLKVAPSAPEDVRYAIAHSLGHFILHLNPHPYCPEAKPSYVGFRDRDFTLHKAEYYGEIGWIVRDCVPLELQASAFADALLAPIGELVGYYKRRKGVPLIDYFGLPTDVLYRRIDDVHRKGYTV
jgi:hypothetical protein